MTFQNIQMRETPTSIPATFYLRNCGASTWASENRRIYKDETSL